MPKKKEKEKNPAEVLTELIKETGTGFFNSFENFFDDVASGAENLFNGPEKDKNKKN
ncbi:MAG: hypothetical protein QF743_09040 [Candidatus Marinimicrobia bacterium]|jgi:hypothetical protein|nr:hypothetical protein [Candidatus Neomarinimicrobiota bacterium]MDP6611639.1 hypothetical protein [Candidatus Neomarinimicrobiota bacterium]|tara:strand:- start:154 stop:324 length:171 start_codon:yes stop_codon:yes gene_type:complete